MGNFTPEQVDIAAKLCEHDGTGSALMLRAYAATLRQQAGRVDDVCRICGESEPYTGTCGSDDPRALCKRTPVLHEQAVGVVATRPRVEGYEVGPVEVEWLGDAPPAGTKIYLRAALAQNTQGEEAVAEVYEYPRDHHEPVPVMLNGIRFTGMPLPVGTKLYLHAERARVPEGWVLVPREPTPEMAAAFGYMATRGFHACYESMLSAAPSQRAEVKS